MGSIMVVLLLPLHNRLLGESSNWPFLLLLDVDFPSVSVLSAQQNYQSVAVGLNCSTVLQTCKSYRNVEPDFKEHTLQWTHCCQRGQTHTHTHTVTHGHCCLALEHTGETCSDTYRRPISHLGLTWLRGMLSLSAMSSTVSLPSEMMPTPLAMALAVMGWSPVTMITWAQREGCGTRGNWCHF